VISKRVTSPIARDDHHIYRNLHGPYRPRIYKAMGLDILNIDESGIKYYLYGTKE